MLHRQNIFGKQFAGMRSNDGRSENGVLARRGQNLDEPLPFAFGDGAIEPVELVARNLVFHALFARLALVQPYARDFRIEEGHCRNHAIVRLEPLELAEQRVDAGEPRLMAGRMRKLIGARDIARRVDVGKSRSEKVIGHDCLRCVDPDILEPVAG